MVSEARKQSMAWMETDYSKHTYFRWKVKWRLEHLSEKRGKMRMSAVKFEFKKEKVERRIESGEHAVNCQPLTLEH